MSQSYTTASRFKRIAALIYDSLLIIALLFLSTFLLLLARDGETFGPNHVGYILSQLMVGGLYLVFCWTKGGQTLGMLAWRIKLINSLNQPITVQQGIKRYVFACLGFWLGGIGILWMFINRKQLSLADYLSQTRMVSVAKS